VARSWCPQCMWIGSSKLRVEDRRFRQSPQGSPQGFVNPREIVMPEMDRNLPKSTDNLQTSHIVFAVYFADFFILESGTLPRGELLDLASSGHSVTWKCAHKSMSVLCTTASISATTKTASNRALQSGPWAWPCTWNELSLVIGSICSL